MSTKYYLDKTCASVCTCVELYYSFFPKHYHTKMNIQFLRPMGNDNCLHGDLRNIHSNTQT